MNTAGNGSERSGAIMDYKITLIPGDGIGPEVTNAAVACVDAVAEKCGFGVVWEKRLIGETSIKEGGELLGEDTLASIRKNKVALKGPVTTPLGTGFRSVNVELRQKLDLYADLRPAKSMPGVKTRFSSVDIVVVRENSEDLYAGMEYDIGGKETKRFIKFAEETLGKKIREDSAVALRPISESATERIAEYAFGYARLHKRKTVTAANKSNILKYTDGLFVMAAEKVSKRYPEIGFNSMLIDALCQNLVTKPEQFDIILCPNFYGDFLSDLCAGLVGGLGVVPSANIGDDAAVFEPVHGSAPKHAGKNEVNPTACILSAAMMLNYIVQEGARTR